MVAAAAILAHQLASYGDGDALWTPEPRIRPVELGDVGTIDQDGGFKPWFNATALDNDPERVPEEFKPLVVSDSLRTVTPSYRGPLPLTSHSITVSKQQAAVGANAGPGGANIELKFICTGTQGAFVNPQDTSTKTFWDNAEKVKNYMLDNHDRWVQLQEKIGTGYKPDQIILVKAFVKTSAWSVAAYRTGGSKARAASVAGKVGPFGEASFVMEHSTKHGFLFDTRYGPVGREQTATRIMPPSGTEEGKVPDMHELRRLADSAVVPESGLPHDQCIFLSYYKIKRSWGIVRKIVANAEDQDLSGPDDEGDEVKARDEVVANDDLNELTLDPKPLDALLDYILANSDAEVAIGSHDDIGMFFNGEMWPSDFVGWLEENRPVITVKTRNSKKVGFLSNDESVLKKHEIALEQFVAQRIQDEEAMLQSLLEEQLLQQEAAAIAGPSGEQEQTPMQVDGGQNEGQAATAPLPPPPPPEEQAMPPQIEQEQTHERQQPSQPPVDPQQPPTDEGADPENDEDDEEEKQDALLDSYRQQQQQGRRNGLRLERGGKIVIGSRTEETPLPYVHLSLVDGTAQGTASVTSLTISPHSEEFGYLVAATSENFTVQIWDLETGALLTRLEGHQGTSWSASFSPDSMKLVSGGADQLGILWDLATFSKIAELPGHTGDIWLTAYSHNGKFIATGSPDSTVKVWSGLSGDPLYESLAHEAVVMSIAFTPNSERLITVADSVGYIWDSLDGMLIAKMTGHTSMIWDLNISSDSSRAVTAAEDGTARIWNVDDGTELVTLHEHAGPVWCARFSPNGDEVASSGLDGAVAICNSFDGTRLHLFEDRPSNVTNLEYSSDGEFAAATCVDGAVKLWHVKAGSFVAEFQGHADKAKVVHFTPDNTKLLTSSDDGTARIWDLLPALRL